MFGALSTHRDDDRKSIRASLTASFALCLFCLVLGSGSSFSQHNITPARDGRDDTARLRKALASAIQQVIDTTLRGRRNHFNSPAASTADYIRSSGSRLGSLTDSLLASAGDSLDLSRRDSLRSLGASLGAQIASHESMAAKLLDARLFAFSEELSRAHRGFADCPECDNRRDFDERLVDFMDFADSVTSRFDDSTSQWIDERMDLLSDLFDSACDSLRDRRDDFIDNRLGDIDVWRYGLTRFVISSAYASHSSYRGRDNGLPQRAFSPSVAFRHSSGLNVQASSSWLEGAATRWDNIQLSGGYEFRLSGITGGSFSYAHFWFNDSSRSELSVFTDNAQGDISFDWPAFSVDLMGSLNFGNASEFTMTSSISHMFEIPLSLYNRITINPTFSWVLGQQDGELTTLLTTKAKGKKAAAVTTTETKASSTFSVLDYEIAIPATIELGPVTLAPSIAYIMPRNVVDASSRNSFINFELALFFTIR